MGGTQQSVVNEGHPTDRFRGSRPVNIVSLMFESIVLPRLSRFAQLVYHIDQNENKRCDCIGETGKNKQSSLAKVLNLLMRKSVHRKLSGAIPSLRKFSVSVPCNCQSVIDRFLRRCHNLISLGLLLLYSVFPCFSK